MSIGRRWLAVVCVAIGAASAAAPVVGQEVPVVGSSIAASADGYVAPVAAPVVVVRPFVAPPGPYAAGHRGVDLVVSGDGTVVAAQAGVVRFAGQVGGRGVVVVDHRDGVRTEYEPVIARVRIGATVERGQTLGVVHGVHGDCAVHRCLHWGARRGGHYIDPMTLLRPLGVIRLVPWDGPDPIG